MVLATTSLYLKLQRDPSGVGGEKLSSSMKKTSLWENAIYKPTIWGW
jgi:hypothetical protein